MAAGFGMFGGALWSDYETFNSQGSQLHDYNKMPGAVARTRTPPPMGPMYPTGMPYIDTSSGIPEVREETTFTTPFALFSPTTWRIFNKEITVAAEQALIAAGIQAEQDAADLAAMVRIGPPPLGGGLIRIIPVHLEPPPVAEPAILECIPWT